MPPSSKITMTRVGTIDLSAFGTKRQIDAESSSFEGLFANLKSFRAPKCEAPQPSANPSKAPSVRTNSEGVLEMTPNQSSTPVEDVPAVQELPVDLKKPIKGPDGQIIYPPDAIVPKFVKEIANQMIRAHNLDSDVDGYAVMIWPSVPQPKRGDKKAKIASYSIPKTPIGVASRIVLSVGSRECFKLSTTTMGHATGNVICMKGDSFSVPIGVSAAIDIEFDDYPSFDLPLRNGFRPRKAAKDVYRRYVCVVDFIVNKEALVSQIKSEAAKLARGDGASAAALEKQMAEMMLLDPSQLSDTDKVAIAATKEKSKGLMLPTLDVPQLVADPQPVDQPSDIDLVVASANCESNLETLVVLADEKTVECDGESCVYTPQ